jgi:hypothetical protein
MSRLAGSDDKVGATLPSNRRMRSISSSCSAISARRRLTSLIWRSRRAFSTAIRMARAARATLR